MQAQEYTPFSSQILKVKKHTDIEYTFSMSYTGRVKPGQFFEGESQWTWQVDEMSKSSSSS